VGGGSVHVPAVSVTEALSYVETQIQPDGNCEVKESEFVSLLAKLTRGQEGMSGDVTGSMSFCLCLCCGPQHGADRVVR